MNASCQAHSLILISVIAAHSGVTVAQDRDPPSFAEHAAVMLDSVNVTAERRIVDIQKISAAVSVIGGDELEAKAIRGMEDLSQATPALTFSEAGGSQSLNIRGIGIAVSLPIIQNGVSMYRDGVFQLPILGANMFYDIDSIEVLRGPQGTLSGNNSTGGAVYIRSTAPEIGSNQGYVDARLGNYNTYGFQSGFNISSGPHLAFRLATNYRKHDSYYTSIGSVDTKAGRLDEKSARLSALLEWDGFSVLARGERILRDMGGMAHRPIAGTEYAAGRTDHIRHLAYNSPGFRMEDASTFTLEVNQHTRSGATIRYVGGYADLLFRYERDMDATLIGSSTDIDIGRSKLYTSELNFISDDTTRLRHIFGLYAQKEDTDEGIFRRDDDGFRSDVNSRPEKSVYGIFGNIDYDINHRLEMQLGLRYSKSRTNIRGAIRIGAGEPGFPEDGLIATSLDDDVSDHGVTGKLALNWNFNEQNMLYTSISRGYKAGGSNATDSTFNPEFVLNHEVGWKTTALDGRFRAQMDIFYSDYDGFQFGVTHLDTGIFGVTNLDAGKIQGFEAQFQALLGEYGDFRIDAGFSLIDSKMAPITFINERILPPIPNNLPQCRQGQNPGSIQCFDYTPYLQTNTGGPYLFSPKITFNLGLQYALALSNGWSLTPRINYGHVGKQYTYPAYSETTDLMPAYGLISALLTLKPSPPTLIELYGRNLGNKEYISGQMENNEFYGPPREYGIRMRFNF